MKTTATFVITLALSVLPLRAGDNHSHAHGHSHADHGEVAIPASLTELWAGIQSQQTALVAALSREDGTSAHTSVETLGAYAEALPGKLTGLDEGRIKRITGQSKNLAKVYDDIHHAADEGAFDKALREAAKAAAVLKLLEPQLPLGE